MFRSFALTASALVAVLQSADAIPEAKCQGTETCDATVDFDDIAALQVGARRGQSQCAGDLVNQSCGTACEKVCGEVPSQVCTQQCVIGCQCPAGKWRDGNNCYDRRQCPRKPTCSGDLEFTECGTACEKVCGRVPSQVCTQQCVIGCQCPAGKWRDGDKCYDQFKCPGQNHTCPGDLKFKSCGTACEKICGMPAPTVCTRNCVPGCQCDNDQWRDSSKGNHCYTKCPPTSDDPCECTTNSKSGSADVKFSGCDNHFGNPSDGHWCYVRGGPHCESAKPSGAHPGAAWKTCQPPTPAPASPICPQSPPQKCRMLCEVPACPDPGSCAQRNGDCCDFECSFPIAFGRPLTLNGEILLATVGVQPAAGSGSAAQADSWGFPSSELGILSEASWRGRARTLPAELQEEALLSFGLSANPFPEMSGTLEMEPELPALLAEAQAGLASADTEERDHWRAAGLAEHASVGSFAKLCLELLVAGAPPRLLRHAIKAQEEELVHAHLSLGLLRGLNGNRQGSVFPGTLRGSGLADTAGGDSGVEHLDLPEHNLEVRRDLKALRAAAIEEGLLGEGRAALRLFKQSLQTLHGKREEAQPQQPATAHRRATAQIMWAIAKDEARHAALAMEIVEWLHEVPSGTPQVVPKVQVGAGTILVQEDS